MTIAFNRTQPIDLYHSTSEELHTLDGVVPVVVMQRIAIFIQREAFFFLDVTAVVPFVEIDRMVLTGDRPENVIDGRHLRSAIGPERGANRCVGWWLHLISPE